MDHDIIIKTKASRGAALMNLINNVSGVENLRVLTPLYDEAAASLKELEDRLAAPKPEGEA